MLVARALHCDCCYLYLLTLLYLSWLCVFACVFRFACCYLYWSIVSLVFLCSVLVVLVLRFACCFLCLAIAIFIWACPMMGTQPAYVFVLCLFCWHSTSLAAFLSLLSALAACSYPAVVFMLGGLFGSLFCLFVCFVSPLLFATLFACFVCLFLVCLALRSLSL